MGKTTIGTAIMAFGLLFPFAIFIAGFHVFDRVMCDNDIVARTPSADGKRVVIVYDRDCGATTAVSTRVSVRRRVSVWPLYQGNTVIIRERMPLSVAWTADRSIQVTHYPATFVVQEHRVAGVDITYVTR